MINLTFTTLLVSQGPNFQAAGLIMANLAAFLTLDDILRRALICSMAPLVTLKAELSITVKAVMRVLAAKDAIRSTAFVGASTCHVSELLAVETFDRWVRFGVVPGHLILHPREQVILVHLIVFFRNRHR